VGGNGASICAGFSLHMLNHFGLRLRTHEESHQTEALNHGA